MKTKEKLIRHDHNHDGLDRRGFLECMAWAGTGMPGKLRSVLGITDVRYSEGTHSLAIVDDTLG